MSQKLTDSIVKDLPAPAAGNKIHYDSDLAGFGCRVTAGGARSFIINYRTRAGRERRFTIGQYPAWRVAAARIEAEKLKKGIGQGADPLAALTAEREAPTIADLCKRFEDEYLPKKRATTQRDYSAAIRRDVLPELKHLKVAEVTYTDIDGLHRKISKRAPYHANRVLAVLSRMFNLAIRWRWRTDNPCRGVERNQEVKRNRYLSPDELVRLTAALAEHEDQQAANIFRLLLLTGARRGEVQAARWADLDLAAGIWTKPGATTKQKTEHRMPLSAPAMQLLAELRGEAPDDAEFVFPGRSAGHRIEIKSNWAAVCKVAGITGARIHDFGTPTQHVGERGHVLAVIGATYLAIHSRHDGALFALA